MEGFVKLKISPSFIGKAIAGILMGAFSSGLCAAGAPRAIVEEVNAPGINLEFMDYVHEGQVIDLKAKQSVSLSYLSSCTQETIVGGRVVVGVRQSIITGGSLDRRNTTCPSAKLSVTKSQGKAAGVIAFRAPPRTKKPATNRRIILRHVSPIIEVGEAEQFRLDQLEPLKSEFKLKLSGKNLLRGRFVDFAKLGITLTPGAEYRATFDKRYIEFGIHSSAVAGTAPLIERLIRLMEK
jgi:hypothetical protein